MCAHSSEYKAWDVLTDLPDLFGMLTMRIAYPVFYRALSIVGFDDALNCVLLNFYWLIRISIDHPDSFALFR